MASCAMKQEGPRLVCLRLQLEGREDTVLELRQGDREA
jgi:hypothetical protein